MPTAARSRGGLEVNKKAKALYNGRYIGEPDDVRENRVVCAYAYAVSEQNASGETVVTAPTCGASGVLPAVMYYYQIKNGYTDAQILHALETAGLIGNLIKTNASISGAECGCQAEIGSACTMAARLWRSYLNSRPKKSNVRRKLPWSIIWA